MGYCIQSLKGINQECQGSLGGIKSVYIAIYQNVGSVSISSDAGDDKKITSITMVESDGKFKEFQFRRNTANMTSTLNVDPANGTSVTTELVMSFLRQEATKRLEISALSMGDLAVIVKDANDKYWYLGYNFPVLASAGTGETGTAFTDGNRYSITLQDNAVDWPYEIKVAPATTGDTNFVDLSSIIE